MTLRLRIGGERTILDPDNPSTLRFLHTEASHEAVFSFLVAIAGFGSLVDVYKPGSEEGAKPWASDHYAAFDGLLCNVRLQWKPEHVLRAAVMNCFPAEIAFEQYDVAPLPIGETVSLGTLDYFIVGLSQMMIVSYFENHRARVQKKYGHVASWPAVWQFARMVRNALSHGNKIHINDEKNATWKGLTYSPADNGRTVVNADLFPGDLIVMLREMEDAL